VHVPADRRFTVVPDTVQIPVDREVKLTASPDDALALRVSAAPTVCPGGTPKLIVWLSGVTVKLWLTDGAAE
jgi:hypothetical protein